MESCDRHSLLGQTLRTVSSPVVDLKLSALDPQIYQTLPASAEQTGTETKKSVILYVASVTRSATASMPGFGTSWRISIAFIIIISSPNAAMKRSGGP